MKFVPRSYQKLIVDNILYNKRTAVFAGMGLGKTASTLEAIRQIKAVRPSLTVLIIAPLRVAQSTWPDEVRKWDSFKNLRVSVICGSAKARRDALLADADIYTINYENIPWLVDELKGDWFFDLIVADESTRLKGLRARQGTQRAKALAKVAFKSEGFVELTGTPAPNGLLDLWGQMWFLDKGARLGKSFSAFQREFFYPISRGGGATRWVEWKLQEGSDKRIKRRIEDVSITVNPEDYFDVAKNIFNDIVVELSREVMRQYRKFARELYLELEGGEEITAANAAVKTGRLLQMASGAVYVEDGEGSDAYTVVHKAKIEALASVIEEANGAPVLCAYSYRHEVDRILKAFPFARVLDKSPQTIRDWNEGKIPLLLAHPASCGHGLNLQDGGNILVFFSCTWSLELHDQIVERIGAVRQAQAGHDRPTFVHYLIAKGTLDEAVKERLATKRDVLDVLLDRKQEIVGDDDDD
ncbi:SNF2-related protein [Parasutterella excrementihominis]